MATDTDRTDRTDRADRTDDDGGIQVTTALTIGAIVTLLGILGFILEPVEGELLGLFGVNALHNAVHLATGLAGLAAGYFAAGALSDEYNKYGGLTYLLLAGLWLVVPALLNDLLNIGLADTLLHLGLGAVLAFVGFTMADRRD